MTISANNWCATCQEACHHHPTVCSVCGTTLTAPPEDGSRSSHANGSAGTAAATTTAGDALGMPFLLNDLRQASDDLRVLMHGLADEVGRTQRLEDGRRTDLRIADIANRLQQETLALRSGASALQNLVDGDRPGPSARTERSSSASATATATSATEIALRMLSAMGRSEPATPQHRNRSTAQRVLDGLPRIRLGENSWLFHQATVELHINANDERDLSVRRCSDSDSDSTGHAQQQENTPERSPPSTPCKHITFDAVRGELGAGNGENNDEVLLDSHRLVLASPSLTGKLPLSEQTKAVIRNGGSADGTIDDSNSIYGNSSNGGDSQGCILYMERGDGVTFAQKARMAQSTGAKAVVVGNSLPSPWPYVMKDSKNEASDITIPVVMIKRSDAYLLKQHCRDVQRSSAAAAAAANQSPSPSSVTISLKLQRSSRECVVCQDELRCSHTILQIPGCGHIFHDQCALAWLRNHNTCPYCRFELPTDDALYELERRRRHRTHGGATDSVGDYVPDHSSLFYT